MLQSDTMRSIGLYAGKRLRAMAAEPDHPVMSDSAALERMLTVELLCRELDFEPDVGFLVDRHDQA